MYSFTNLRSSRIQRKNTHTHTYTHMHWEYTRPQKHTLWGVPKSFRSGRPDTETQETIECQRGPWARHVSSSCAAAYWTVDVSSVLRAEATTLHLVPPLPLLTRKRVGMLGCKIDASLVHRKGWHWFVQTYWELKDLGFCFAGFQTKRRDVRRIQVD